MKTPQQIAAETTGQHFDTYQDSAEEVGHPDGQPIIETWPALNACVAAAIEADRAQRDSQIRVGELPALPLDPETNGKHWSVSWLIDSEAATPVQAAAEVWIKRFGRSHAAADDACIFTVTEVATGRQITLDLSDYSFNVADLLDD